MDVFALFLFFLGAASLVLVPGRSISRNTRAGLVLVFLLKCCCGIALWQYYAMVGVGDMQGYINESLQIAHSIRQEPDLIFSLLKGHASAELSKLELWNNAHYLGCYSDNRLFLLYLAVLALLSGGSVVSAIVVTAFLALFGSLLLLKFIVSDSPSQRRSLPVWIFLFPSLLIWSSGLFKESLLLFPLGLLFYGMPKKGGRIKPAFVIGFVTSFLIKPYVMTVLLPGILALLITRYFPKQSLPKILVYCYIGGLFDVLILGTFISALDLPAYLFGQQLNLLRNGVFSGAHTFVGAIHFAPTAWSFVRHIPEAIGYAFFRPWPYEAGWWWTIPFGLESIVLLLLLVGKFKPPVRRPMFSGRQQIFAYAALALLLLLGCTIPVLGNLVRLRMPAVLFFLLAFIPGNSGKEIE